VSLVNLERLARALDLNLQGLMAEVEEAPGFDDRLR